MELHFWDHHLLKIAFYLVSVVPCNINSISAADTHSVPTQNIWTHHFRHLSSLFSCQTRQHLLFPLAASSWRRWTPRNLRSPQTQHQETRSPVLQLPLVQENPGKQTKALVLDATASKNMEEHLFWHISWSFFPQMFLFTCDRCHKSLFLNGFFCYSG